MSPLVAVGLNLFIIVLFIGLFLCIHGLPGMILIAADLLVYSLITEFNKIGWLAVLILIFAALLTEVADAFLAMNSSPRFGPTRKSIVYSLIGAFACAMICTQTLLVVGLVTGFFLGGLIGLLTALLIQESQMRPSHRLPLGAIFGRMSTLFLKGALATGLVCFTLLSSYD